jgi:PPOX class probable F420-dependent enzyme
MEAHVATMATIRKDGFPTLTAVWYLYEPETGDVLVSLTDTRAKYRHIQRDARVALAICGHEVPYKEVVFEGRGVVTDEDGHEFFRRVSIHYYGERDGNAYADYSRDVAKDGRVVMRLKVERIRQWDFAVEDDYHQPWEPSSFEPTIPNAPAA